MFFTLPESLKSVLNISKSVDLVPDGFFSCFPKEGTHIFQKSEDMFIVFFKVFHKLLLI